MKGYEKYKLSGFPWIGEIPEHWNLKKLKYLLGYKKGTNPKNFSNNTENCKIYLTMDYLRNEPKQIFYVREFENYICVNENEILLLCDGSNAGEFLKSKEGVLSSTMAKITVINENIEFSWYLLKTVENKLKDSVVGMGIPHVDFDEFRNSILAIPTLIEQKRIATYLDHKIAQIDDLIEKKRRLIEVLNEEKQALINHAVTKGLNPKVKMKDSGIPWIGEIPEHWEMKKLKYVTSLKSGNGITSDDINERGNYPVYGGNGLRGYTSQYTHEGNYILIGRQGALCGNINYAMGRFFASEHAVVANPKSEYNVLWFGELLRTMNLNQYSVSAAQPGLSVDNLKLIEIPFPPEYEQNNIADYLEIQTRKIGNLIKKQEKTIELLLEYRTALISEAVTGKIDLRGEQ